MTLTKEQMKILVTQWKKAAPELERVRNLELTESTYDWRIVDALLEMGSHFSKSGNASGLVEMQRLFMLLH